MQEFSSISVSSYEAGALAGRLTEQSRDGWSVVAIVPAGSTITAYLSRHADGDVDVHGDVDAPADSDVTGDFASDDAEPTPDAGELDAALAAVAAPTPEPDHIEAIAVEAVGHTTDDAPTEDVTELIPEPADTVGAASAWGAAATALDVSPVDEATEEPAGEISADTPADLPVVETTTVEPSLPEVTPQPATAEPAAEPAVAEPAAAEPAVAEPAAAVTAAAGAAPAGWYADPSSRFELRYWDGTQWTEHVSRSGQQYTDPPVA